MKTLSIFQLGLIVILSISFVSCSEEEENLVILQSYLDVSTWEQDLLLPYSDETYGYDFSLQEHNNTSRDCYLTLDAVNIVNSFLFDGVNHIKKYDATEINFKDNLEIPNKWDEENPVLEAGAYYLLECADGYAIVKPVAMHFSEWVIDYIYIPNTNQVKVKL